MKKQLLIVILLLFAISISSCETAKRVYLGIGKFEVSTAPKLQVIKYYTPFFKNDSYKTNLLVISNYDSANKILRDLGVPRIFLKNRETEIVYELSCFEDIKANIENINNNVTDVDFSIKNEKDFDTLKAFISNNKNTKLLATQGNSTGIKKWDICILYTTSMGKKIRRLTLPVTELHNLNELTLLDLSVDESALEIN